MFGVHHRTCPVAFGLLYGYDGVSHFHKFVLEKFTIAVIGRKVFKNLSEARKHPTVAACPEIFLFVHALMFGPYIFGISVVQALVCVVHDAVAHLNVLVQLIQILFVTCYVV